MNRSALLRSFIVLTSLISSHTALGMGMGILVYGRNANNQLIFLMEKEGKFFSSIGENNLQSKNQLANYFATTTLNTLGHQGIILQKIQEAEDNQNYVSRFDRNTKKEIYRIYLIPIQPAQINNSNLEWIDGSQLLQALKNPNQTFFKRALLDILDHDIRFASWLQNNSQPAQTPQPTVAPPIQDCCY